ncbi:hypothetical protein [Acidithiobacillus ferrooxidans]|uniref:hypothetical protein n=1 Tax=Acidithiobacillus ferrooxidans TaxID=920 RepID=UPI000AF4CDE4|nr:hypothetical protein [Acidithiobacillus ferrooxidans]
MTTAQTQTSMYYDAVRHLGERDAVFMEIFQDGLTRQDLATNIERRPSYWGRYAGFFQFLPSSPLEDENDQHRAIIDYMLKKITENGLEVMERHPTDVVVFDRKRLVQVAYPGAQLLWMVSNTASHLFLLGVHPDENRTAKAATALGMDFVCHIQVGRTLKLSSLTPDKAALLCDSAVPGYTARYITGQMAIIHHHEKTVATLRIAGRHQDTTLVTVEPAEGITPAERGAAQLWAEKYHSRYAGSSFAKGEIIWTA